MGDLLSSLTLHPSQSGVAPYLATFFALEGTVPSGKTLRSEEAPSLEGAVLSRWPDGSASVVVLAGELSLTAGSQKSVGLRAGPPLGAQLTAARVGELVTSVIIDCGGLGTASLTSFGAPERTWWANSRVVCCRYRVPVGSEASLQAVVDVHAFASNRALVEVVLENGAVDPTLASPPKPATRTYGATVTVNGSQVINVSSPAAGQGYVSGRGGGSYAGGHEAFRAWFCSYWVGGDPGVEVTHQAASLQAHPMFFRCWKPAPGDFRSTYQDDRYQPWSAGRLNVPGMPGTGDIEGIGPFAQWDTRYLQTGSPYVRRAVLTSALGALSCNVSMRDGASGLVPTHAQTQGHNQDRGSWPNTTSEPSWELAHHPAAGLVAFLCHPSPVFIEVAQKVAIWNATCSFSDGVFGFWAQVRGKAWGIRSLAHALFLTPDGHPWKAPAKQSLLTSVADWAALQPVRYVNEAAGGEWRLHNYLTTVGRTAVNAQNGDSLGSGIYAAIFWAALVVATERGVPGADAAWAKVTSGITNLEQWASSLADEPRYNRYPRNK